MESIFRALADSGRRALLEKLHHQNGQTLTALCGGCGMTRQAVAKHLGLLEGAGLVATTWAGREKHHWLKVAPLRKVQVWAGHFEADIGALPRRLRGRGATETRVVAVPPELGARGQTSRSVSLFALD